MIAECPTCRARCRIERGSIPAGGARVRCPRCEAVFRVRAHLGRRLGRWMYEKAPGFAPVTERAYRLVADHRRGFSFLTSLLWGADPSVSTYTLARGLFIRLVGIVFLIAFVSLWVQIDGLVSSKGIVPIAEYLELVHANIGARAYRLLPTLCWFDASDAMLNGLCLAGLVLSLLLVIGLAPIPVLLGLWATYLSVSVAGQAFLGFQWDTLLLAGVQQLA